MKTYQQQWHFPLVLFVSVVSTALETQQCQPPDGSVDACMQLVRTQHVPSTVPAHTSLRCVCAGRDVCFKLLWPGSELYLNWKRGERKPDIIIRRPAFWPLLHTNEAPKLAWQHSLRCICNTNWLYRSMMLCVSS